jgi:hypothetical protein
MYDAPSFLIETGWREDLQLGVIVMFAAAILSIIGEAFVCLTRPKSKLGNAFVPVLVIGIGVFLGSAGVLGYQVSKTPFNEAYWKTYELQGAVLAADYAVAEDNSKVPMAILDFPTGGGVGYGINMSDNTLNEYVGQNVTLECLLVETDNGAMDHICTFVGDYQEASA